MEHLYKNVYVEVSLAYELLTAMFRIQCHEDLLPQDPRNLNLVPKELTTWVEVTRKNMTESYKQDLEVFFNYESFLGMILVPGSWQFRTYKSIEEFLEGIRAIDSNDLIKAFLCTGYGESYSKVKGLNSPTEIMNYIKGKNLPESEKWKLLYMFYDADNTKNRLINLISYFYENFFKDNIEFLINHHKESIHQLKKALEEDPEEKLNKLLGVNLRDYTNLKEIVLIPSYYYITSALSSLYEEISAFIYLYGTMQLETSLKKKLEDQQLIDAIKAMADENRIKIIRILNTTPCYGYELGQKLSLSNSTISHHLSLLTSLGIINSYRDENKIYYEVDKDHIKKILESFSEFLT